MNRRKRGAATAPLVDSLKRKFRVTHPFHPLSGCELELLGYRRSWRREYLDFDSGDGRVQSIPLAWTDAGEGDPYVAIGGGRSCFRVEDLEQLARLIEASK